LTRLVQCRADELLDFFVGDDTPFNDSRRESVRNIVQQWCRGGRCSHCLDFIFEQCSEVVGRMSIRVSYGGFAQYTLEGPPVSSGSHIASYRVIEYRVIDALLRKISHQEISNIDICAKS